MELKFTDKLYCFCMRYLIVLSEIAVTFMLYFISEKYIIISTVITLFTIGVLYNIENYRLFNNEKNFKATKLFKKNIIIKYYDYLAKIEIVIIDYSTGDFQKINIENNMEYFINNIYFLLMVNVKVKNILYISSLEKNKVIYISNDKSGLYSKVSQIVKEQLNTKLELERKVNRELNNFYFLMDSLKSYYDD